MFQPLSLNSDIYYVGASDRTQTLFESAFPIPDGMSYNSYLIKDEKTALLDTCDRIVSDAFLDNLSSALGERKLDYLIINHMEPDHCATALSVIERFPGITVAATAQALKMLARFFVLPEGLNTLTVADSDTLDLGSRVLTFRTAPMVHWPEVMVTYDPKEKVLFSADAFGSFGALGGSIISREGDFDSQLPEIRRYYTNIVGKYGVQTAALLAKAEQMDIACIAPLHGHIRRCDIAQIIGCYKIWSAYEPEDRAVVIAYASIYGHTAEAAQYLACGLARRGVEDIAVFDVSRTHYSYILAQAFRASHIVFAGVTYNNGIFPAMQNLLDELTAHNFRSRTAAVIQNGSWAPASGKLTAQKLGEMKDIKLNSRIPTILSAPDEGAMQELSALADDIAQEIV